MNFSELKEKLNSEYNDLKEKGINCLANIIMDMLKNKTPMLFRVKDKDGLLKNKSFHFWTKDGEPLAVGIDNGYPSILGSNFETIDDYDSSLENEITEYLKVFIDKLDNNEIDEIRYKEEILDSDFDIFGLEKVYNVKDTIEIVLNGKDIQKLKIVLNNI